MIREHSSNNVNSFLLRESLNGWNVQKYFAYKRLGGKANAKKAAYEFLDELYHICGPRVGASVNWSHGENSFSGIVLEEIYRTRNITSALKMHSMTHKIQRRIPDKALKKNRSTYLIEVPANDGGEKDSIYMPHVSNLRYEWSESALKFRVEHTPKPKYDIHYWRNRAKTFEERVDKYDLAIAEIIKKVYHPSSKNWDDIMIEIEEAIGKPSYKKILEKGVLS